MLYCTPGTRISLRLNVKRVFIFVTAGIYADAGRDVW
jgi:hypothetical protein